MSSSGWSDIEMRNLCRNMASLIEIEIKKFETVYQIVMMAEPPIALDAELLVKKLLDRGTKPYDGQTQTSPIFEALIKNLLTKLEEVIHHNPVVMQVINDNQGHIMKQEMKIFIYRLSLIVSWGLVLLDNIFIQSRKIYDQLDDWIVVAVEQENKITRQVTDMLRDGIEQERGKFEEYSASLPSLLLMQYIEATHFTGQEVMPYLRHVHVPSDTIENTRFTCEQLDSLYSQFRYNTPLDVLDTQSFQNIMLLAYRQGQIPLVWKFKSFDCITQLATKFMALPMKGSDPLNSSESPMMYQAKSGLNIKNQNRDWVSWKQILFHFVLINSSVPTEKELANLRVKLSEAGEA